MTPAVARRLILSAAEGITGMVVQAARGYEPVLNVADREALFIRLRPNALVRVEFDHLGLEGADPTGYVHRQLKEALAKFAVELRALATELEAIP